VDRIGSIKGCAIRALPDRSPLGNVQAMVPDLPQTEAAIVEMTNTFRKANQLKELQPNSALTAAARAFADYLARSGKFSHEADGRTPQDRALAHGYRYCLVAENLAWNLDSRGYDTRRLAREVVEGWKASPGHRKNLLLAGATEIGVAVVAAPATSPKFVSVQVLGRPEAAQVRFAVRNLTSTPVRYALGAETETVHPREAITHTDCEPRALSFEGAAAPAAFSPKDGDRFTVRPGKKGGIEVSLDRGS
jgi:uncharacterized protein YkwD